MVTEKSKRFGHGHCSTLRRTDTFVIGRITRSVFGSRPTPPELRLGENELTICEGSAAVTRGLGGGRWGPLILTNYRLLWYESARVWPLKPQSREIALADISSVDTGTLLDRVFGGKRLRVHLCNGRTVRFFEGQGKLDWWVAQLRHARDT